MPHRSRAIVLSAFLGILLFVGVLVLRGLAQAPARPTSVTATPEAIRANNLGVASMSQQKFEQAFEHFQKAAAVDPTLITARINQAVALINLQRYDEAREILTAAGEKEPENPRVWFNLGLLQRSTGEADAALASFQKVSTLRPRDAHSHYFIGLMAAQLQKYDEAIPAFTRALEMDPFLVSAEFGLARAYQRAGKAEESKRHLERFQRVTTEKIASAMTLSYGDQGPLSLAEPVMPQESAAPPAIAVTFSQRPLVTARPLGRTGAAGCLLDFDADGNVDYLSLGHDGAVLMRNTGGGAFVEHARLKLESTPKLCAVADYDNDERADIALGTTSDDVVLFHNDEAGAFTPQTKTPLAGGTGALAALTFVDYDHDADVDLLAARTSLSEAAASRNSVWRNNGDATFAEVAAERGLAGSGRTMAMIASDLNNDRAIDLVFTGEPTTLLVNPREGEFKALQPWSSPMPSRTLGVVTLDFDKDGWMDLAFTHIQSPGVSLWKNTNGTSFTRVELPDVGSALSLTPLDYDNDGWIDLALAGVGVNAPGRAADPGRMIVFRNDQGKFVNTSESVGIAALKVEEPRVVMSGDVDNDGDSDLVVVHFTTDVSVLRNDGGNKNNSLRLTLKGLNDNRSGVGTKVEVQAGAVWQKFETIAATGLGQSAPHIIAGIGPAKEVDVVRLLWPTGVVQDEVQIPAGAHTIEQIDRRGSSCPILFTWNGREYEFITDAVGPAVVGHWVAPGERNVPDPDEYIKVDGRQLQPRDGRFSIKFMEPMEEVIYLDEVRLLAIDHPRGTEIFPSEYFAAIAPQPAATVFGVKNVRLPLGAWDGRGRDVSAELKERDGRHVTGFADAPFKGFAELHALELDLGPLTPGVPVRLIMSGFTDYFTATSVFAAHQANVTAIVPYLEAQTTDLSRRSTPTGTNKGAKAEPVSPKHPHSENTGAKADGRWARISDDIGFPAGLRRTMTADLTGKLPAGTRRVRIWTNLKVYWDQVLIDTTPDDAVPMRRSEAPLRSASLAFRGFPRERTGTPAADLTYSYQEVSRFGPWARHRGSYTRYGNVTPLLGRTDDRFVIFGAGEETSLEFDANALPPLGDGWTRDYLFYARAYVKDMDFYAAHGQTVTPLPFREMGKYPYPETTRYPDRLYDYLLEWNTRLVDAESWPSYRLSYRRQ
jgi:Flp pilus assembly protein TadD